VTTQSGHANWSPTVDSSDRRQTGAAYRSSRRCFCPVTSGDLAPCHTLPAKTSTAPAAAVALTARTERIPHQACALTGGTASVVAGTDVAVHPSSSPRWRAECSRGVRGRVAGRPTRWHAPEPSPSKATVKAPPPPSLLRPPPLLPISRRDASVRVRCVRVSGSLRAHHRTCWISSVISVQCGDLPVGHIRWSSVDWLISHGHRFSSTSRSGISPDQRV
jgi:hypothetical protein